MGGIDPGELLLPGEAHGGAAELDGPEGVATEGESRGWGEGVFLVAGDVEGGGVATTKGDGVKETALGGGVRDGEVHAFEEFEDNEGAGTGGETGGEAFSEIVSYDVTWGGAYGVPIERMNGITKDGFCRPV